MIMGIVYKVDLEKQQRMSDNIEGDFTEKGFLKITSGSLKSINVSKGDFISFSHDDLSINSIHKIVLIHTDTFCEVIKAQ